jgi:HIV Tat-specific factor 1
MNNVRALSLSPYSTHLTISSRTTTFAEQPRVKLYRTAEGQLKGDGVVSYLKKESVELAIKLRDGAHIRPGVAVTVSKAVYDIKPGYQPKKRAKTDAATTAAAEQQKELGWEEEEGDGGKPNVHVVLKGMFTLEDTLNEGPGFVKELREDVASEAGRVSGGSGVASVTVFEHNPEGVVVVKFHEPVAAARCIAAMDGRFFAGRRISATPYDRRTNFKVEETEEHKRLRLERWQKWLDEQGEGEEEDDQEKKVS